LEIAENGFINRMHYTFIAHSPSCAFDEWKGKKKIIANSTSVFTKGASDVTRLRVIKRGKEMVSKHRM